MPIRLIVCSAAIAILIVFSWRRSWFIGACGAVVLMAVVQHPEMPRTILGIPGLSPWNILIINVTFAWLKQRGHDAILADMPASLRVLLRLFIIVICVGCVRVLIDPTRYCLYTTAGIINEGLVNSLKIMLPFFLFYDGCRSEKRVKIALLSILTLYVLLGVIVVKHMGLEGAAAGEDLNGRGAKLIHASTGFHRVDMAMMLAGASWGVLACTGLAPTWKLKVVGVGAFLGLAVAEGLTGGRTGYVTWCLIGLALCVLRWRRYLVLIPVAVIAIVSFMPAVAERMLMGFGSREGAVVTQLDQDRLTSGRIMVWPYALNGISESPLIGYGRFGFQRSGTAIKFAGQTGEELLDHPHNAYLEMLLDNGIIGSAFVIPLYCVLLLLSVRLFRDRSDPLVSGAGGLATALLMALLIAASGAQTLYPREGVAGMWAALGIMARLWVDRYAPALIQTHAASTLSAASPEPEMAAVRPEVSLGQSTDGWFASEKTVGAQVHTPVGTDLPQS